MFLAPASPLPIAGWLPSVAASTTLPAIMRWYHAVILAAGLALGGLLSGGLYRTEVIQRDGVCAPSEGARQP